MESSSSFADLLEALEAQSSALALTHYAVSMPTLEEVFLACTAEPSQAGEAAEAEAEAGAETRGEASGRSPSGLLLSPDGSCVIQMSELSGAAVQGEPTAQKQTASSVSISQEQAPVLQHAGSSGEASEHQNTAATQSRESPARGGSLVGAAATNEPEVSSDTGVTSDHLQHDATQQPTLSISRDDSAHMLWHASEEAAHSHEHAKSHVETERPPGHDPSESLPSSSGSSHQGASSSGHDMQTGMREHLSSLLLVAAYAACLTMQHAADMRTEKDTWLCHFF